MKRSTFTPLVALVLIGAGGFMAGRLSSSHAPGDAAEHPAGAGSGRPGIERSRQSDAASRRDTQRHQRTDRGSSPQALARLSSIMRSEDPLDRNRALFAFIDRLGPADFKDAVDHFRSLGLTESRMGEYALLLSGWTKMDPLAALDFAGSNPDDQFATNTVLASWASRDPDAALRWADASHDGSGPNPYLAGVIRGIAETDPERATEMLSEMPRGPERDRALRGILPQLMAQGPEVARSWIESLADEALRNGAMKQIADDMAALDPAGTAQLLLSNPGDAAQHRLDDVYRQWARIDQQAALESVATLPAGENRSNALRGVVGPMAASDPAAALSVIERYPEDVTDRVMKSFLWYSLESDPGLAVSQIPRIQDEGRRDWWYDRTLGSWLDHDPAAANAWIRQNPLPQPVLDQITTRPE